MKDTGWKPPRRGRDASFPVSIHQSNPKTQSFIKGKGKNGHKMENFYKKWILAVHPSIKPKNQSLDKEKGKMDMGCKPPRRSGDAKIHPSIKPEKKSFNKEKGKNGHGIQEKMLAVHPSMKPENQSFIKEKEKNGHEWRSPRRGEEMLAIHPSIKPKINRSSGKKGKMDTGRKPPRRRGDPSFSSINQTRNSIIHQRKREKWWQDGNLLEEGKRS